jgi:hypothetical protein
MEVQGSVGVDPRQILGSGLNISQNGRRIDDTHYVLLVPTGQTIFTFTYFADPSSVLRKPLPNVLVKKILRTSSVSAAASAMDLRIALDRKNMGAIHFGSIGEGLFDGQKINGFEDVDAFLSYWPLLGENETQGAFHHRILEGGASSQLIRILMNDGRIPNDMYERLPRNVVTLDFPYGLTADSAKGNFEKSNGVDIWYYFTRLFAFALHTPIEQVWVQVLFNYSTCSHLAIIKGSNDREPPLITVSRTCLAMAISTTSIPNSMQVASIPSSSGTLESSAIWKMDEAARAFLQTEFPKEARMDFLGEGDDTADLVVRGIKNLVIAGGEFWERLEISIVRIPQTTGFGSVTIRLFVDGTVASGIGNYPPDTQFTTHMEPKYAKSLAGFADKLTTDFRRFIMATAVK